MRTANRTSLLYSFYFRSTQQDTHERAMCACLKQLWGHMHSAYVLQEVDKRWSFSYTHKTTAPPPEPETRTWDKIMYDTTRAIAQHGAQDTRNARIVFAKNTALVFAFVEQCMIVHLQKNISVRPVRARVAKTDASKSDSLRPAERDTVRYADMLVAFFAKDHRNLAVGVLTAMRMLAASHANSYVVVLSPGMTAVQKTKQNPFTNTQAYAQSNRAKRMHANIFQDSDVAVLKDCLALHPDPDGSDVRLPARPQDSVTPHPDTDDDDDDVITDPEDEDKEGMWEGDDDSDTDDPDTARPRPHRTTMQYETPLNRLVCTLIAAYSKLVDILGPRLMWRHRPLGTKWVYVDSTTPPTGNAVSTALSDIVSAKATTGNKPVLFEGNECITPEHRVLRVGDYTRHKSQNGGGAADAIGIKYARWEVTDDSVKNMHTHQDVRPVFIFFCRSADHAADETTRMLRYWTQLCEAHGAIPVYVGMDADTHTYEQTLMRHRACMEESPDVATALQDVLYTEFDPTHALLLWDKYCSPLLPALVVLDMSGSKSTPSFGARVVTTTGWRIPAVAGPRVAIGSVPRHEFERHKTHRTEAQWFDDVTGTHIDNGRLVRTPKPLVQLTPWTL